MLLQLASSLWAGTAEVSLFGGVRFPCRMTLIRLPEGGIWMHSPIKFSEQLASEIEKLGEVTWLVAPNLFHHLFLGDWVKRFPNARLWGGPGLSRKRKDLAFTEAFGHEPPPEWGRALDQQFLNGAPGINETVFYHRDSRTLIITDLIFNIERPRGLMTKIMLTLTGTRGKTAHSRLWRFLAKDRIALGEALKTVLSWDFERVVVAHGEMIEKDARAKLKTALACYIDD